MIIQVFPEQELAARQGVMETLKTNNMSSASNNIEKDSQPPELADDEGEPPVKKRRSRGRPKGSKARPITDDDVIKELPPRSCRRNSVPEEVIIPTPPTRSLKFLSTDWTETERQKLLSGLRVHNYSNHEILSKFVGTKSAEEVGWFIHNLKNKERLMLKEEDSAGKNAAPIEHWLKTCEDIVRYETDHSLILGSVMAVAGDLEPHHPPYNPKTQPDYTKIYDYLARLLQKGPAPELSPIDSAVVLDLLQNSVDVLRRSNLSHEREMMKKKYLHLNTKIKDDPTLAECESEPNMGSEPNEVNVDEVRQQVYGLSNGARETGADNNPDGPSTSREENHSSGGAVGGTQSQESNTGPSSSAGTPFLKKSDGPKVGKLVSINPFCIEVKYLKLSNIQKETPR